MINDVIKLISSLYFTFKILIESIFVNINFDDKLTENIDISYTFLSIFFKGNFYFLLFMTTLAILTFTFSEPKGNQNQILTSTNLLKVLCAVSFLISMGLLIICFYYYLIFLFKLNNNFYFNNMIKVKPFNYKSNYEININFDFFGMVILLISYFVGLLSFLALDNKMFSKNMKYFFFLNLFIIIVFFFVTSNNILTIFLLYEFLLIPSFLLVFFISPGRKSTQASLYFIIWTQIGSFLVLCAVFYIITIIGSTDLFLINSYFFSKTEIIILSSLLFLGFGFKVPIWPFHYWLTKTHVEAPSGFSMYLSGFLVKTALYGFYKIINTLSSEFSGVMFTTLCMIGIVDSSLKMWGQTDLKKLVAYGTVQEMNIIYLTFCWGDSSNIISGVLFCITHAFLSTIMFFLVDCIQRRYASRSVIEISGILQQTPNLGITILAMCIFYSGLPGTLKFTSEFYIFSAFIEIAPMSAFLLILIANCLGLIGFSKLWFNVNYGMSIKNSKLAKLDLTLKELFIVFISLLMLVLFCYAPNIFF